MRTQAQINERIEAIKDQDFFGVERKDLIDFLDFDHAKAFLKEGVTSEEWKPKPLTEESIKHEAKEYLPFAWEKANNCRGLSANRSVDHLRAYAWLLGDEVFTKFEEIEYEHYGKEKLIYISEVVGFDWEAVDDGERINTA